MTEEHGVIGNWLTWPCYTWSHNISHSSCILEFDAFFNKWLHSSRTIHTGDSLWRKLCGWGQQIQAITSKGQGRGDLCMTDVAFWPAPPGLSFTCQLLHRKQRDQLLLLQDGKLIGPNKYTVFYSQLENIGKYWIHISIIFGFWKPKVRNLLRNIGHGCIFNCLLILSVDLGRQARFIFPIKTSWFTLGFALGETFQADLI